MSESIYKRSFELIWCHAHRHDHLPSTYEFSAMSNKGSAMSHKGSATNTPWPTAGYVLTHLGSRPAANTSYYIQPFAFRYLCAQPFALFNAPAKKCG